MWNHKIVTNKMFTTLVQYLTESERLILLSAINKKGVFNKHCDVLFKSENNVVFFDGEFMYPLGVFNDIDDVQIDFCKGILGGKDNVRHFLKLLNIKDWLVMDKTFCERRNRNLFTDVQLPRKITIDLVTTDYQLRQFCFLKSEFLYEESGERVMPEVLYNSISNYYKSLSPTLLSCRNQPIGMISSNFSSDDGVMINMFFVEKNSRNHGYGKLLLKWYINYLLKSFTDIYLFYSPHNHIVKSLYKNFGFNKIDDWSMAIKI